MIEPTGDQQRVVNELTPFFERPGMGEMHFISGYAGTGKTSTVGWMRESGLIKGPTVMSAPTHKAVRVLNKSLSKTEADFATIQSLLMVKPAEAEDGRRDFISYARPGMKIPIMKYENVILDESSMMDDGLMQYLKTYMTSNMRILFLGDGFQLPPVSHEPGVKSIPFREPEKHGIIVHNLNDIVRQKEDNSIIPFASELRQKRLPPDSELGKNIRRATPQAVGAYAIKVFASDEYKKNRDRFRFLAYTNERVNAFNASVHNILTPRTPESDPVAAGEVIILREPFVVNEDLVLQNNDELTINTRQVIPWKTHFECEGITLDIEIKVLLCHVTSLDGTTANIILAMDQVKWDNMMDKLFRKIKFTKGMEDKRAAFKKYWALKGKLATWKHSYGQTIHTAQGSTFYETGLDTVDVKRNWTEEYWNLMYTGVTRSSDILTLI